MHNPAACPVLVTGRTGFPTRDQEVMFTDVSALAGG